MNIKELQKAWNRLSADTEGKEVLTEDKIREILNRRTNSLMERIDKNIRRGLLILFLFILALCAWDFLSPAGTEGKTPQGIEIPYWVLLMDRGMNILFLIIIVLFHFRYNYIRKQCGFSGDLRQSLVKVIHVLTTYRKLFTLALILFLMASASAYIAGFYRGFQNLNSHAEVIPIAVVSGLITLLAFTGVLFLIIRWVFRRLYGKYLFQLRDTLRELDELGE